MKPDLREKLREIIKEYPGAFYADPKDTDEAVDTIAKLVIESLPERKRAYTYAQSGFNQCLEEMKRIWS